VLRIERAPLPADALSARLPGPLLADAQRVEQTDIVRSHLFTLRAL
jgi:hypothetical protein